MSDDANNEYFSDGISEELLSLLAKIPQLRVISRTSAFSYKGKDFKIADVARELNVSNVLEGSVRKDGNRVRITVQLIEGSSDTHIWSETYDRTLDDIFLVQDEIAAIVVNKLKVTLLDDSPTVIKTDPEAYALYLQANQIVAMVSPENILKAAALYKDVLATDPKYAPAWLGLSRVYGRMAGLRVMPAEEAGALARQAVNRALEISPDSAQAHSQLAWDYFRRRGEFKAAAHHFERAITLEPTNTDIIGNVSIFVEALGRKEQAISLAEYQVSRDPANAVAQNNLGMRYRYAGRYREAIKAFSTALVLNPSMGGVEYELGVTFLLEGDYAAAASAFAREPIDVFGNLASRRSPTPGSG